MGIFKRTKPRVVVDLDENYWLVETYYRCGWQGCPGREAKPFKAPNEHAPPGSPFSFNVMAKVAELRWKGRHTYEEIVDRISSDHCIDISRSSVETILKTYEIGCATKYGEAYKARVQENGGVILTVDGMKPLKGTKGLYVAYDYLTDLPLGSKRLKNEKNETIAEFIEDIKKRVRDELGAEIIGVVSDALPAQRIAIEKALPGVPHCLCHYHFYEFVLKKSKEKDKQLLTSIRSELRNNKHVKAQLQGGPPLPGNSATRAFTKNLMDALVGLANWKRRPKDPCFSGLELFRRLADVMDVLDEAKTDVKAGCLSGAAGKAVIDFHKLISSIIGEHEGDATELGCIAGHLSTLKDILTDLETSSSEGLKSLQIFRTSLRKHRLTDRCGPVEREFIESLMKYVKSKGELLFNFKDVPGAPRTNNAHELRYKQLKHLLRKVIGFSAANSYLLAHGERIVFVNPLETFDSILEIMVSIDHVAARKTIASERKSRNSMCYVVHDPARWDEKVKGLRVILQEIRKSVSVIS